MSDVNFQFVHQPSVVSTEDLFICGKCRNQFNDLNLFLVHRSTCSIPNPSEMLNVCPLGPSSPSAALLCSELDAILRDVDTTTTTETEVFYPPNNSNSFDELFPSTTTNENENQTLETNLSQMSLLECPVCDEQFDAPIVLENHVFEHSTVDDSSSSYVDILDEQQTAQTSLECKQCTVTFTSNASLNIHKKICKTKRNENFSFSFSFSFLFLVHCLNPVFRCLNDTCAQLFDKPVDYILHARVHSQKRIRRSATYRRHRKRTYRCRICKNIFFNSDQLQNHLTNEAHKFLCQLCPAEFDSNNSYHNHLAKHSDGAIYRCTICIETFQKRHDLSRHVLTKHNDDVPKQKSCDSCKLTFKTTFHLNRHNNTKHSDVKPFKCEQDGCDKAFAR